MRIRKNAKLASGGFSQGSAFPGRQAYMCQLNQSPWDVMSFGAPEPKDPNPLLPVQFEGDDSFTGNGSLGDSIGAVESVAFLMDSDGKAAADVADLLIYDNGMPKSNKVLDDNEEVKFGQREGRKEDHYGTTNGKRGAEKQLGLGRRGRPRVTKRGSTSASNPYEFYYYSGFGPSWGKRRGERGGGEANKNETKEAENNSHEISTQKNSTSSSSSQINDNNEEFDFIDDEDDEEYEDNSKKRMRKPVKARSLKSLM